MSEFILLLSAMISMLAVASSGFMVLNVTSPLTVTSRTSMSPRDSTTIFPVPTEILSKISALLLSITKEPVPVISTFNLSTLVLRLIPVSLTILSVPALMLLADKLNTEPFLASSVIEPVAKVLLATKVALPKIMFPPSRPALMLMSPFSLTNCDSSFMLTEPIPVLPWLNEPASISIALSVLTLLSITTDVPALMPKLSARNSTASISILSVALIINAASALSSTYSPTVISLAVKLNASPALTSVNMLVVTPSCSVLLPSILNWSFASIVTAPEATTNALISAVVPASMLTVVALILSLLNLERLKVLPPS